MGELLCPGCSKASQEPTCKPVPECREGNRRDCLGHYCYRHQKLHTQSPGEGSSKNKKKVSAASVRVGSKRRGAHCGQETPGSVKFTLRKQAEAGKGSGGKP